MKGFLFLLALISIAFSPAYSQATTKEKKRYVLYAEFIQDTPVELSDGSKWMMDKGDCFPVHMFKDQQTRVVLQLATATFSTPAYTVKVLGEADKARADEAYAKMVDNYMKSKRRRMEEAAAAMSK